MKNKSAQSTTVIKKDAAPADPHKGWLTNFFTQMKHWDGWKNILTGLGTGKDARTFSQAEWRKMSETDIENLYASSAMAEKICDMPIDDAFTDGFKFGGLGTSDLAKFQAEWDRLKATTHFRELFKRARQYGGACLLKVYNDDLRMENPVDVKNSPTEIKNLLLFNRFELFVDYEGVDKDMLSPTFGTPKVYQFIGRGAVIAENNMAPIHASRMIRVDGAWLPDRLRVSNNYWHDTVLSKVYDAIRNYETAHDSMNQLTKDLSVGVFKIKNLASIMTGPDGDTSITNRLHAVNMSKSIARAVVVDAEGEGFEWQNRTISGAGELVGLAENRLAADSKFPKTKLFGTSPQGGLGQSGDTEGETWYKFVEGKQKNDLEPIMLEFGREICAYLGIKNGDKLTMTWNPLWSLSEKEEAELRNKQAQTDQIYMEWNVTDPSEVRKSRFMGDKYSIETTLDKSLDSDKIREKEKEEATNVQLLTEKTKNGIENPTT
jgi:phage-related protein (TIGR01555 family)